MKLGPLGPDSVLWASHNGELGSPSSLFPDVNGEPQPAKAGTVPKAPGGAPGGAPGQRQVSRLLCSE